ncbi:hypothetical protein HMPREF3212_04916 [Citrobacter freundii]|nr:hypothetical protein HMPREF3212_04916 [Citrobacter freundii]
MALQSNCICRSCYRGVNIQMPVLPDVLGLSGLQVSKIQA